jgi:hypothetical protein
MRTFARAHVDRLEDVTGTDKRSPFLRVRCRVAESIDSKLPMIRSGITGVASTRLRVPRTRPSPA